MNMKMVKVSEIAIPQDANFSRGADWFANIEEAAVLAVNLIHGWDPGLGLAIVTKANGAEHRNIIGDMVTDNLTVKTPEGATLTVTPEDVRGYEPEVKEPKYELVAAFRRLSVLPLVNALRERMSLKPIAEVPCEVIDFANVNDRIIKCLGENGKKTAGSRRVADDELLTAAFRIYENGGRESDLMKAGLKRGTSQKLWSICRAQKLLLENGEAGLIEEIRAGNVAYGPLDAGELRRSCEAGNITSIKDQMAGTKEEGRNEPKMMSKKDITTLAEQSLCRPLVHILKAVLANDRPALMMYGINKDAWNALFDRITNPTDK